MKRRVVPSIPLCHLFHHCVQSPVIVTIELPYRPLSPKNFKTKLLIDLYAFIHGHVQSAEHDSNDTK